MRARASPALSHWKQSPAASRLPTPHQGRFAVLRTRLRRPLTRGPWEPTGQPARAGKEACPPLRGTAGGVGMGKGLPRDCSAVLAGDSDGRACTAGARWVLTGPGLPMEWPICNVHRGPVVDMLLPDPVPPGWVWIDRRGSGSYPVHGGCSVSSFGRRQTCQGAGSPSMAGCPLTAGPSSESPSGARSGRPSTTFPSMPSGVSE